MWIAGFFLLSNYTTKIWMRIPSKEFLWKTFSIALILRVFWVLFSYYFYIAKTGAPFEIGAADAIGYHEEAKWLSESGWEFAISFWSSLGGVSDTGYSFWLTSIYSIFGPSIIIVRLIKCLIGSATCVFIYKLASRNIGELPGRMAAIFSVFMPNLIIYCGLHLKETEMLFLCLAFLERADYLIRSRKFNVTNIIIPLLCALCLFFFRTVLGVVALMSMFAGLLFTSSKIVGNTKRFLLIAFGVFAISSFSGGVIATEVEGYWEARVDNQIRKREGQEKRGAKLAKYATGTVLAPMIFVMPFSTMVDTGQDNQMILHAGNFVRNFFGIFVLIALFNVLFKERNWRNLSLLGSFTVGYLGIISVSGYGNAERFLLPGLPCLIIIAAYGISRLNGKYYKFVKYWFIVVVLMEVSWAFFKLKSHGIA